MPPLCCRSENTVSISNASSAFTPSLCKPSEVKIVWRNVVIFALLHIGAVYGLYLMLTQAKWSTWMFTLAFIFFGGMGITAGAHRLWSHKSYKAKLPLRIMLMIFNNLAMQNSVIVWARDHRMHHKYSDTDADPHNINRGFFFSHIGWLLMKKRPEIMAKGTTVDMNDLWADPVLRFQYKNYVVLSILIGMIVPAYTPTLLGESLWIGFFVCGVYRYVFTLNGTWLVNSAAHMWGFKPYDKNKRAVQNATVCVLALGEGFHNYHHTFPWDYKTAELGDYSLNLTKCFIDGMSKIGWAYDLKTVDHKVIANRVKRTGDGTHKVS